MVLRTTPSGSIETAMSNAMAGFNHRQQPGAIPLNKDNYGFTFFTRPNLNLIGDNLRSHRIMNSLLNNNPNSIHRQIRCWLDPELGQRGTGVVSPLVDNRQAFIPILSNSLISMGGWPDISALLHHSDQGIYKEESSWIDGPVAYNSTFEATASFRNLPGNPVVQLLFYWLWYASLVYLGVMVPYPKNNIQTRIDYNTRIYRLVMDESKRYVRAISACGAAFPISCPIGAMFNFETDHPINPALDQISVSFKCIGAMYFDDILVDEFNRTSVMFNPTFADGRREQLYHKLTPNELALFNNQGFPRINPDSLELEWWVDADQYNSNIGSAKAKL
jgi:hypothetical protein